MLAFLYHQFDPKLLTVPSPISDLSVSVPPIMSPIDSSFESVSKSVPHIVGSLSLRILLLAVPLIIVVQTWLVLPGLLASPMQVVFSVLAPIVSFPRVVFPPWML